jgi:hypothetical protein
MDVNPPQEDDQLSRCATWVPVIQAAINGMVSIILELISQGRHPL